MIEIEILQVALGNRDSISRVPTAEEWYRVMDFAVRQTIVGVMFHGVEQLVRKDARMKASMPMNLLMQWYGITESLKEENAKAISQARRLSREFEEAGFRTCVLKGVGNLQFYGNLVRTPGDIDLWVMPKGVNNIDEARKMTQRYVHTLYPDARGELVHMDWPWKEEPVVEIHFTPSMDVSPRTEKKLQRFFEEHAGECFGNKIENGFSVPTKEVNALFLLHHMKRHFLVEGLGLRHVVDYALFLKSLTDDEQERAWKLLKEYHMTDFAKGIVYIMGLLGYETSWPMDERRGKFVLHEIMVGGNFGNYDSKKTVNEGAVKRWLGFINMAFNRMLFFPRDAMWSFYMRLRVGFSNRTH